MCCWAYEDVYLEDPPPKKEKEKDENTYIMMSSEMPQPAEQPVEAPVSQVLFVLHMHKARFRPPISFHSLQSLPIFSVMTTP